MDFAVQLRPHVVVDNLVPIPLRHHRSGDPFAIPDKGKLHQMQAPWLIAVRVLAPPLLGLALFAVRGRVNR